MSRKVIALSVDETEEYKLKGSEGAVFTLKTLDSFEQAYLMKLSGGRNDMTDIFAFFDVVRLGVIGWTLKDKKGMDIPCIRESVELTGIGTRELISNQSMKHLHAYHIRELAGKVIAKNFMLEDDAKN